MSQVKNRGVLQVLSEEVSLKEAPECGQGLGGPDNSSTVVFHFFCQFLVKYLGNYKAVCNSIC